MKVVVWGAGEIGLSLAYRLVTTDVVSRLGWINRTLEKIETRVVDLEHGLALAPCCHEVRGAQADDRDAVEGLLRDAGLVVLTHGVPVGENQTRADLYENNRQAYAGSIAALRDFEGVVLVVTNPVDALAKFVRQATGLPSARVIGLGTMVETARLRAAVAGYLVPSMPARQIGCYAIGTHDEETRLIRCSLGPGIEDLPDGLWPSLRSEVVRAPRRVKRDGRSTRHPVIEAVVSVARAVALDSGEIMTVSVEDDATGHYFSVPVAMGRAGALQVFTEGIDEQELLACRSAAAVLQA
jgi:L-lactate dehydrogenase